MHRLLAVTTRPTEVGRCSTSPHLLSLTIPLAASLLEFGQPGFTTPGIFRPWPFSDLRRFTPPDNSPVLFHTSTTYGIQRTRTARCFSRSPDRSILRQSRPGLRGSDTFTFPKEHEHGICCLLVAFDAAPEKRSRPFKRYRGITTTDSLQAESQRGTTSTCSNLPLQGPVMLLAPIGCMSLT